MAILDRHFTLSRAIDASLEDQSPEGILATTALCEEQVGFAKTAMQAFQRDHAFRQQYHRDQLGTVHVTITFQKPGHRGYDCLVTSCTESGRLEDAIRICRQARHQGWQGDWDHRIRLLKRARKRGADSVLIAEDPTTEHQQPQPQPQPLVTAMLRVVSGWRNRRRRSRIYNRLPPVPVHVSREAQIQERKSRAVGHPEWERALEVIDHHVQSGRRIERSRADISPQGITRTIGLCEDQVLRANASMAAFRAEHEFAQGDRFSTLVHAVAVRPFLPPVHEGFTTLIHIRTSEGNIAAAIDLCEQARSQGWSGDWQDQIVELVRRQSMGA